MRITVRTVRRSDAVGARSAQVLLASLEEQLEHAHHHRRIVVALERAVLGAASGLVVADDEPGTGSRITSSSVGGVGGVDAIDVAPEL